ncbi:hypothetical protein HU200_062392 [Digitaria exilis]|uniref:Uncharacterized protein n=1 Tax=Digitaria exilis TaxID=1010633 RepID=A0A835A5M2_9POAL|nr:hypothetical protein HU200_062392 [Digitaria exilis]
MRLCELAAAERETEMLQFPALMRQWPSPPLIPASTLLPVPATSHEDELLLAMAESDLEDKVLPLSIPFPNGPSPRWIRCPTHAINLVFIGKPTGDTKEEYDAEVEEDDADNVDESDGDDFDQETG